MLNKQIKYYRISLGLSQVKIAEILKISQQCYSGYECGTREPNIQIIKKLCVIFNCSADELLEIETESQREEIKKLI